MAAREQPSLVVAVIAALPPTLAAVLSFVQARLAHKASSGTAVAVEQLRAAVDELRGGLVRVEVRVGELSERVTRLEERRGRRRRIARRP